MAKQFNAYETFNYLYCMLDTVKDDNLRRASQKLLSEYRTTFTFYPAAKSHHHCGEYGLIKHTEQVVNLSIEIMNEFFTTDEIDEDVVVVGALFHDIGKIIEYEVDVDYNAVGLTMLGQMQGHLYLGGEIVKDTFIKYSVDDEKIRNILHVIHSHHGIQGWGAIKEPRIVEAQIVHYADNLSAKMQSIHDEIIKTPYGEFSDKTIENDRTFYQHIKK